MAILKCLSAKKKTVRAMVKYIEKLGTVKNRLLDSVNCCVDSAADEMEVTKKLWNKEHGRQYKHFVISFHKDELISHKRVLAFTKELVCKIPAFEGFQSLLGVHIDKDHKHCHILVNSVNAITGKKLRWSKHDLQDAKNICNEMCLQRGLSVAKKGKTFEGKDRENISAWTPQQYWVQKLAEVETGETIKLGDSEIKNTKVAKSYIKDIAAKIIHAIKIDKVVSKNEFIDNLFKKNVIVKWEDKRKNITFTDQKLLEQGVMYSRCSVRDAKLATYFGNSIITFSKEGIHGEFNRNAKERAERGSAERQVHAEGNNKQVRCDKGINLERKISFKTQCRTSTQERSDDSYHGRDR
jgi:hypothetical protein